MVDAVVAVLELASMLFMCFRLMPGDSALDFLRQVRSPGKAAIQLGPVQAIVATDFEPFKTQR